MGKSVRFKEKVNGKYIMLTRTIEEERVISNLKDGRFKLVPRPAYLLLAIRDGIYTSVEINTKHFYTCFWIDKTDYNWFWLIHQHIVNTETGAKLIFIKNKNKTIVSISSYKYKNQYIFAFSYKILYSIGKLLDFNLTNKKKKMTSCQVCFLNKFLYEK